MSVGRVCFGGLQAPRAAAGEVWPDPLPVYSGVLCVDLNGFAGVFVGGDGKRALLELGVSVGLAMQLGRVRAHGVFDGLLG